MNDATRHARPDIDLLGKPRYRPVPDPSVRLASPVLQRLYTYWRSKAGIRPPQRADLDPLEIGPDIHNVILLDVRHDPLRFRWRLLGGELVEAIGRNMTGRRFEDVYPHPVLVDITRVFSRATLTGLPIRHVGSARFAERHYLSYESLHCPLVDAAGQIDMVFGGLHFGHLPVPAGAS